MNRVSQFAADYPRQFWFLSAGLLISSSGGSMIWPFLTIYIRQRLDLPLTTVGLLFGLTSTTGLITTLVAGPVADRSGRKGVMLLSMFISSIVFAAMGLTDNLHVWAILMAARGTVRPLHRVGSDAMVVDLVAPSERHGGFALLRVSNNLGIIIGPVIGGFIAVVSYSWAFFVAAAASLTFALLILMFVTETLPPSTGKHVRLSTGGGYDRLLRDKPFVAFCGLSTLAVTATAMLFLLLPVYAKEQFGVAESQYGFIVMTNAVIVVVFQYAATRVTKRYPPMLVVAVGTLLYALGVGSVAWGHGFTAFLASMVILTIGELTLTPTAMTLTANLSPPDMRGRYMGIYDGLTWELGMGIGPMIGGFLNDHMAPVAIWYGGSGIGLTATLGFLLLAWLLRAKGHEPV